MVSSGDLLRIEVCRPYLSRRCYSSEPASGDALSGGDGGGASSGVVSGLGRLNHVAIATPCLATASRLYRDILGATVSPPQPLPEHGVTCVFVSLTGGSKIELLEPLGDRSPIAGFLRQRPSGGIHHVCLEVADLEAALKRVRDAGVRCLSESPRIGAHGKPVMFLHPADCAGVLMELEEA